MRIGIVGAGPVGLACAAHLILRGFEVTVWEKRETRSRWSRAIGLHAPGLQSLAPLGIVPELIEAGVKIERGHAFYAGKPIGTLDLTTVGGPFPFALSLPQTILEAALENWIEARAPGTVRRGVEFGDGFDAGSVDFLVGCDGAGSAVRRDNGFRVSGGTWPDRYVMGDFPETDLSAATLGTDAGLFFGAGGIVESFPMPGGARRWVAWLGDGERHGEIANGEGLCRAILTRTGFRLDPCDALWISPFGISQFGATRFSRGNVALVGDAARVVSPIGGQGMNRGMIDAARLAAALESARSTSNFAPVRLWERESLRRAGIVSRRAAFNTIMGRPIGPRSPRRALISLALGVPWIAGRFAENFTMGNFLNDLARAGVST